MEVCADLRSWFLIDEFAAVPVNLVPQQAVLFAQAHPGMEGKQQVRQKLRAGQSHIAQFEAEQWKYTGLLSILLTTLRLYLRLADDPRPIRSI